MPFEEILRRVKDQAELEKEAQGGRANISLGASQANGHRPGQEFETWGEPAGTQFEGGGDPQELNSTQTRQGTDGKGQRQGGDRQGNGEKEKERKEEIKEVSPQWVDVSSAEVSTGLPSAHKTTSRKEARHRNRVSKGCISRKKCGSAA